MSLERSESVANTLKAELKLNNIELNALKSAEKNLMVRVKSLETQVSGLFVDLDFLLEE